MKDGSGAPLCGQHPMRPRHDRLSVLYRGAASRALRARMGRHGPSPCWRSPGGRSDRGHSSRRRRPCCVGHGGLGSPGGLVQACGAIVRGPGSAPPSVLRPWTGDPRGGSTHAAPHQAARVGAMTYVPTVVSRNQAPSAWIQGPSTWPWCARACCSASPLAVSADGRVPSGSSGSVPCRLKEHAHSPPMSASVPGQPSKLAAPQADSRYAVAGIGHGLPRLAWSVREKGLR